MEKTEMNRVIFCGLFFLVIGCATNEGVHRKHLSDISFIEDSTSYSLDSIDNFQSVDSYSVYSSKNISLYYVYPRVSWCGFSYVYAYNKLEEREFQIITTQSMGDLFVSRQKKMIDSLYALNVIDSVDYFALYTHVICAWEINAAHLSSFSYFRQMQKTLLRLDNLIVAFDLASKRKMLDKVEYMDFWQAQPNIEITMFHTLGNHKGALGKLYRTLEVINGSVIDNLEQEYENRKGLLLEKVRLIEPSSSKHIVVMLPEMELFTIDLEDGTSEDLILYENDSVQTNVLRLKLGYYQ